MRDYHPQNFDTITIVVKIFSFSQLSSKYCLCFFRSVGGGYNVESIARHTLSLGLWDDNVRDEDNLYDK